LLPQVEDLPEVDVAVLAIPAGLCLHAVNVLCAEKSAKGIIIFSAGFSEESPEGAKLEEEIRRVVDTYGATLIGPNCVGYMNENYTAYLLLPFLSLFL